MTRPDPPLLSDLVQRTPAHGSPVRFSDRPLEEDELAAVLAAGRVAPSADNAQTWRFLTVRDAGLRRELGPALPAPLAACVAEAPLALVVCGVPWVLTRARREQPFVIIDVPIAVTHLLLLATELGLACSWSLECDEEAVRTTLGVPDKVRVVAVLALGWPEG